MACRAASHQCRHAVHNKRFSSRTGVIRWRPHGILVCCSPLGSVAGVFTLASRYNGLNIDGISGDFQVASMHSRAIPPAA
jgi:hypothetical protein